MHYTQVEERQSIREKIKESYKRNVSSMEDLLETCAAMEEEFIYLSALSRLEYFKNGIQFDKRIVEKRRQLMGSRDVREDSSGQSGKDGFFSGEDVNSEVAKKQKVDEEMKSI